MWSDVQVELTNYDSNLLADHQEIQSRLREACVMLPSFQAGELPTQAEIKGFKSLSNVLFEGKPWDVLYKDGH